MLKIGAVKNLMLRTLSTIGLSKNCFSSSKFIEVQHRVLKQRGRQAPGGWKNFAWNIEFRKSGKVVN